MSSLINQRKLKNNKLSERICSLVHLPKKYISIWEFEFCMVMSVNPSRLIGHFVLPEVWHSEDVGNVYKT